MEPLPDEPQELSINTVLSNEAEYFDLLFDLLNIGSQEITEQVWALLI
jgi:hypothetical protein